MDFKDAVGQRHLFLITLDTLRYDVAQSELREGRTPNLRALVGDDGWERRHTPGSFTYAAHTAFFAGFLPTPARPGRHPRPFAAGFEGSETTTSRTWTFDAPEVVTALRHEGYRTVCVGGVGFFNKRGGLGNALPSLFEESHWSPSLGVAEPKSFENQIAVIEEALASAGRHVFLFLNVSALHQPNRFYLDGAHEDSLASHAAALRYVDRHLPRLVEVMKRHGQWYGIVCSDHGTTYGDDGYTGHRLAHPAVWDVPYAELEL